MRNPVTNGRDNMRREPSISRHCHMDLSSAGILKRKPMTHGASRMSHYSSFHEAETDSGSVLTASSPTPRSKLYSVPGLGRLLRQRDAITAERDALFVDREMLNAARNSEVNDLTNEKVVLLAKLAAIEETAHQLLVLRNEPRAYLADRFLRGTGIEIGALHRPLALSSECTVRYVDRKPTDDLHAEYPEWERKDLSRVDIVDNGETLATIENESIDFLIANHFLEHCEDPIRTLRGHLARLRTGGHLFYAVPDKRHTFDRTRSTTTVEHLVEDHIDGGLANRFDHFKEYAEHVQLAPDPQQHALKLIADDYSIHFHVWTSEVFLELLLYVKRTYEPSLEVVALQQFEDEFVVVIKKH
jgi:predicted SAM-dependent methyltransferase